MVMLMFEAEEKEEGDRSEHSEDGDVKGKVILLVKTE